MCKILYDLRGLGATTFPGPPLDEPPGACGFEDVVRDFFGSVVGGVPAGGGAGLAAVLNAAAAALTPEANIVILNRVIVT